MLGNIICLLLFIPQLFEFLKAVPDENFWLQKAVLADLKFVLIKLPGHDGYFKLLLILYFISPLVVLLLKFYGFLKSTFSLKIFFI